jgi:hypothetical protein
MAGRGPAPKDPSQRARRNKDPQPLRVIDAEPTPQPDMPATMPGGEPWPTETVTWWAMWKRSPLAAEFTDADWSFLLDTALVHGRLWSGDSRAGAELRLRVDQFGMTPTSRARLRITFAQADAADEQRGTRQTATSRDRYGDLRLAE